MRIIVPFISDIVGKIDGKYEHVYALCTTTVDIPVVDLDCAPEALIWDDGPDAPINHGSGNYATHWHADAHWAIVSASQIGRRWWKTDDNPKTAPTPGRLASCGFLGLLHDNDGDKLAQVRQCKPLKTLRGTLSDIHSDNTDELAEIAGDVARQNIIAINTDDSGRELSVAIRCNEPHIGVLQSWNGDRRARDQVGFSFTHRITPNGFASRCLRGNSHLVSYSDIRVAEVLGRERLNERVDPTHINEWEYHPPGVLAVTPESLTYPWHLDSAACAINGFVETGRKKLPRMSTEDVRLWLELARLRDNGIGDDSDALEGMCIAEMLQMPLGIQAALNEAQHRLDLTLRGQHVSTPTITRSLSR